MSASATPVLSQPPQPTRPRRDLGGTYVALATCFLALALRLNALDRQPLWWDEAISIHERFHWFDKVERIGEDGTAVFTADSGAAFREILGYDCPRLRPEESEDRAHELIARYREFARRHGVEG